MLMAKGPNRWIDWPRRVAVRAWRIASLTVTRWSRNDGNLLAASMAYYAAFSFFPLLLVLISALGYALEFSQSAQDAREQLLAVIAERMAPAFEQEVRSILAEVQTRAAYGLWALVVLLFGAIGIFSQMDNAFERLWQDTAPHQHGIRAAIINALWNRLKAFLTLLALGGVLIMSFVADFVLAGLRTWAADSQSAIEAWPAVQSGTNIGINAIVLMLIYKLIPQAKVRWFHAACGGIMVAIVWQIGSQILARFVVGGNYSAYGVVGSFVAMMLWVYFASILLFLGGQLVQVLGHPEPEMPDSAVPTNS
jgi:membrane protein